MGDASESRGSVIQADETGVIGEHDAPFVRPLFVSPTREDKQNTVGLDVVPIACLNVGDLLFEFDSSVVRPAAGALLSQLPAMRRSRPNAQGELPLVGIWGHADPTGDEEYNKTLSGRRAKAVYALLAHKPAMWDELFSHPFGGDDWSKKLNLADLADSLGLPHKTARTALFDAQMTAMCPEPLEPSDFLGRGADSGGKADFQGCGEFNPLLILSTKDGKELAKRDRDLLNLVDRRVVVFLFRPEVRLAVGDWPCPRASEGTAGCRKRFFLDAKKRLEPGPERRRHKRRTDDTFACRFYDRIAGNSPCEQFLEMYRVRLFDKLATPLPGAPFTLTDGKRTVKGRADDDAFVTVRDLKVPANVHVEWQPADDASKNFQLDVHVEIDGDDDSASLRRLHNIGYEGRANARDDVEAFQADHKDRFAGMQVNGALDDVTRRALRDVNDECDPSPRSPPTPDDRPHKKQGDKVPPKPEGSGDTGASG